MILLVTGGRLVIIDLPFFLSLRKRELMIKSMTGYGKETIILPEKKITVEIKSLNSKQFDFNIRIPSFYREKEQEIRQLVARQLVRGKVDFFLHAELSGTSHSYAINKSLALSYYRQLKDVEFDLDVDTKSDYLALIMKMPDVLQAENTELNTEEWAAIYAGLEQALVNIDRFRVEEGAILYKDISARINIILELMEQVTPFEEQRIVNVRQKLEKEVQTWMDSGRADQNRFEQELIFYIEKLDITEEKVRLKRHCDYFLETMSAQDAQGKKLGFIAQEIGREINTMGSKANEANIQKIVVQMKDELEKIKEQLFNIL